MSRCSLSLPATNAVPPLRERPWPIAFARKTKWAPDEDDRLMASVCYFGCANWTVVAQGVPGRTGKQCRERWVNQISPTLSQEVWSVEEDAILTRQHSVHGNAWVRIAQFLPGRSSNSVKNRWVWLSRHSAPDQSPVRQRPLLPPANALIRLGDGMHAAPEEDEIFLRFPAIEQSFLRRPG
jgi:hypothetical protein